MLSPEEAWGPEKHSKSHRAEEQRGSWESAGLAGTECACEGPSGDGEEPSSSDHTEGLSVRLMGQGFTTIAGKVPAEGAQEEVDRISTTVFR